jgi:Protein of unknown function (DUF3224)
MMKFLTIGMLVVTLASAQTQSPDKGARMSHHATGSFEVKVAPLTPYNQDDKLLGRFFLDKQFHGDLEGTSKGEMLSAGNPSSSAGAVAIEKITGKLDGHNGSFVLQHYGIMEDGKPRTWNIVVVPGSGSGELAGIAGTMSIKIEAGKHYYIFEYTL